MTAMRIVVIAKAPLAGRSKTRLCPPCTEAEAAGLAEAALRDTLDAVVATPAERHVLALEGTPGDWLPDGFEVVPQRGRGLAERLAHAFDCTGGPALLVGMDTPQLTAAMLGDAAAALAGPNVDAVLGPALDGGYWAIGLQRPNPEVFANVPMSVSSTAAVQRRRLRALGLRHVELPGLRDVDTIADAHAVAAEAPDSRFARALRKTSAVSRPAA